MAARSSRIPSPGSIRARESDGRAGREATNIGTEGRVACDGAFEPVDIVISSRQEDRGLAQFLVRNLEDDVAEKLKKRARRHARSMEDEVRHILRAVVRERATSAPKLGTRIAQRFSRAGLSGDLPELRGGAVRAADFSS
jgi:plasmid stability protein